MPVNTLTFNQAATVLNSILQQATGQSAAVATNTGEFVSQAQTALLTGYDTIMDAVSQVLTRTIFSIRPYSAKFRGMEVTESSWGNHVRKISIAARGLRDDDAWKWPVGYDATQNPANGNGQSVDPFVIAKPDILQTNFYGSSVYEYAYTLTRNQMRQAFRGPEEFSDFVSLQIQERSNELEQARENFARGTLVNYIAGLIASEGSNDRAAGDAVIPVLSLYNQKTGLSLTATSVYQPANYKAFVQWLYAFTAELSALLEERSEKYQTVIGSKHILRHTPVRDQRIYFNAGNRFAMEMMAQADVYHDTYLRMAGDVEAVTFWQAIDDPMTVKATASYTGTNGAVKTAAVDSTAEGVGPVLGVIMDREAAGYAVTDMWSEPARNGRGGYTTYWDHAVLRSWNDFTEKGLVLLMA